MPTIKIDTQFVKRGHWMPVKAEVDGDNVLSISSGALKSGDIVRSKTKIGIVQTVMGGVVKLNLIAGNKLTKADTFEKLLPYNSQSFVEVVRSMPLVKGAKMGFHAGQKTLLYVGPVHLSGPAEKLELSIMADEKNSAKIKLDNTVYNEGAQLKMLEAGTNVDFEITELKAFDDPRKGDPQGLVFTYYAIPAYILEG